MAIFGGLSCITYVLCIVYLLCFNKLLARYSKIKLMKVMFALPILSLSLYIIGFAVLNHKWSIGWIKGDCDYEYNEEVAGNPFGPAGFLGLFAILISGVTIFAQVILFCEFKQVYP
mmetsp:Transcript_27271/g.12709  ORF Transcript_27271/g.12709 Transcript_27271/m.12709 type:complete len:116 (-) Transcript_27271:55-402(-)